MKPVLALIVCLLLAACGDKVPESKAARDIGDVPKQTIDRATTGVDAAIKQGAERSKEEDKK